MDCQKGKNEPRAFLEEIIMILNLPSRQHHCKYIECFHLRNECAAWHFSKLSPSICFQANATELVQQICEESPTRYLVPVDEDSTDPPKVKL